MSHVIADESPGQTNRHECGINISQRNYGILEMVKFEKALKDFIEVTGSTP